MLISVDDGIQSNVHANLANSPYNFYRTGKEFYGSKLTGKYDYSYFAENSNLVVAFLLDLGFKIATKNTDETTNLVIPNVEKRLINDTNSIEIMLVNSLPEVILFHKVTKDVNFIEATLNTPIQRTDFILQILHAYEARKAQEVVTEPDAD